jgi:uncharacterized protein YbbK (DUF523 family)
VKIGISACLMGKNCRYNGACKANPALQKLLEGHEIVEVCPECAGGLSVPRKPCEIKEGRVLSQDGQDFTDAYTEGAKSCLKEVEDCDLVILQKRSPSCGGSAVYDGTFSGKLVPGQGVFARMVKEAGLPFVEADSF